MTANQAAATSAAIPHPRLEAEDEAIAAGWAGPAGFVELPGGESASERKARLEELATATLCLSLSGDDVGSVRVELPCEVHVERPLDVGHAEGGPEPLSWLVVRVEAYEPVLVGATALTAFSVAVPDHRGPGRYELDELRRRADADLIEWWEVDDFHLSPGPQGSDRTYYLDVGAIDGAYVATSEGAVEFDIPMASTVSEIRASGTITWDRRSGAGGMVAQMSRPR